MSSMTETEMESQRNRLTLEEARWTGVRKKVPGMSGLPTKARTKTGLGYESGEDPFQRVRKNYVYPEFQIRGGTEDNLKIIFLISYGNICCDPSLELPR